MTEFTKRYYPTISIRRGEMRAFEKLPISEKEKMLPIALLAPWLNSIKFDNTINILKKCVGNQPIIVDLDRYYQSDSSLESRKYFWSLLNKETGPKEWINLIRNNPNYIPCIQMIGIDDSGIDFQVDAAREMGRGFCFRFELERYNDFENRIEEFKKYKNDDCLIVIDFGYTDFSLLMKDRIIGYLGKIFSIFEGFRVTVCGSSFPNDFSDFDEFARTQPIAARSFHNEILKIYGNYNVFYGDWASTKPRKYDGGGSQPLPRIDFPTPTSWIIARSRDQKWSLQDAAERITRLPEWSERPIVWGTGMIEKTAKGVPGGITTHPEAIAARINTHLFIQANFGGSIASAQPKGKWKDPI